jgi:hypothetical protein
LRDDALYPILQSFTYGETISVNDAVYLKASDGKVYKTNASYNDERIHNFIGFAKEAGNNNDIKMVQIGGVVEGFSGLTTGSYYYLSDTAGGISSIIGTHLLRVGIAINSTKILLLSDFNVQYSNKIEPSDDLLASANTERSTSSTNFVKVKEIRVNIQNYFSMQLRVDFELRTTGGSYSEGLIFRNGLAAGTVRTAPFNYQNFSENINFNNNDLIQLYIRASSSYTCFCRNFRIYCKSTKYLTKLGIYNLHQNAYILTAHSGDLPSFTVLQD